MKLIAIQTTASPTLNQHCKTSYYDIVFATNLSKQDPHINLKTFVISSLFTLIKIKTCKIYPAFQISFLIVQSWIFFGKYCNFKIQQKSHLHLFVRRATWNTVEIHTFKFGNFPGQNFSQFQFSVRDFSNESSDCQTS